MLSETTQRRVVINRSIFRAPDAVQNSHSQRPPLLPGIQVQLRLHIA